MRVQSLRKLAFATAAFGLGAFIASGVQAQTAAFEGAELLPPNAKPGECYARVFIPPVYETENVTMVKSEASERLEIIPAKYGWREETIMIEAPSERIEVVPATYEWVEERIMVEPEKTRIEEVPAVYETVTERIVDRPAHTIWKKGTGPFQRIDHATGEIMCLVEVPATYKIVSKRVLKTPATTRTVTIPARYETVRKRVVKTPATTRTVTIPAKYKAVKVRQMIADAETRRVPIPAQYQMVTKRNKVSEGRMAWQSVLCRTNATPETIKSIQRALLNAGHNPGPIDGVIGSKTMAAVASYQRAKGLPVGNLSMETLQSLGVRTL